MYIGLTHILFNGIVVEIKKINQYSKKFMVNISHCLTLLSVKNTHPKLNLLDNMSLFFYFWLFKVEFGEEVILWKYNRKLS